MKSINNKALFDIYESILLCDLVMDRFMVIGKKERVKPIFMELIDKNQLYINYCDIDDETFAISENDKDFTKSFYKEV